MKHFVLIFCFVLTVFTADLAAQDTGAGHRIVFQLTDDDPRSRKALIGQLDNLTTGWPEAEIEVVVHSAGIGYLRKSQSDFAEDIARLSDKGVMFKACENTMRRKNIPKSDILDSVGLVPMGIGQVVLRQEAGWSYIKAGL